MLAWTQRQMESALTRVQKWQTVATNRHVKTDQRVKMLFTVLKDRHLSTAKTALCSAQRRTGNEPPLSLHTYTHAAAYNFRREKIMT